MSGALLSKKPHGNDLEVHEDLIGLPDLSSDSANSKNRLSSVIFDQFVIRWIVESLKELES